jgi:hypothetical protein
MGVIDVLNRLDQRVLPRLSRGLHRLIGLYRRRRTRPLVVIAAVLVVAVVATLLWQVAHPERVDLGGGHSTVWVGIRDGDLIPRYQQESGTKLKRLAETSTTPAYALVSLSAYVTPQRVAELAQRAGGPVSTVSAIARLPKLDRQTQTVLLPANRVPDDIIRAMAALADSKQVDAETFERLALGNGSRDEIAMFRSNADLAREESAEFRKACACIFGIVVLAKPAVLLNLSRLNDVRVVEAVPGLASPRIATYHPPLPEQQQVAAPPPDDNFDGPTGPAPSPSDPALTSPTPLVTD